MRAYEMSDGGRRGSGNVGGILWMVIEGLSGSESAEICLHARARTYLKIVVNFK